MSKHPKLTISVYSQHLLTCLPNSPTKPAYPLNLPTQLTHQASLPTQPTHLTYSPNPKARRSYSIGGCRSYSIGGCRSPRSGSTVCRSLAPSSAPAPTTLRLPPPLQLPPRSGSRCARSSLPPESKFRFIAN